MDNYNILITGSNGFLGRSIYRTLKNKKYNIKKIDIKKIFFEKLNKKKINNSLKRNYKFKKKNILIHLGWGKIGNPQSRYHKINFQKSKIIFDFCSSNNFKKVIFCGSINEYGYKNGRVKESDKKGKIKNLYSKYKLKTTKYGLAKIKNFFSLRCSYIYGYQQRKGTLIDYIIKNIKLKKKINISHCMLYRDYIFVDDVANAFLKIITTKADPGVYNVGSGKLITLKQLVLKIVKYSNFRKNLTFDKFNKNLSNEPNCFMNINKIKKKTGWKIKNTLDQGVDKILRFHKIN